MASNTEKRELFTGCCMLLSSAVAFYFANRLPDSRVVSVGGTGLVPFVTTSAMLLFSLLKCLSALAGSHGDAANPNALNPLRSAAIVGLVALYALCLETAGFPLASFLLLLLSAPLFGLRRLKVAIAYSAGVSLAAWILFSKIFASYLPSGTFFR